MKGVVFTEFIEMVEDKFGFDIATDIIDESELPSGGAYTAVGTYPHSEMVSLVVKLSEKSGIEVTELLKAFGQYLFGTFHRAYGKFFENVKDSFDFLQSIDQYIHREVLKLYPDAELPEFSSKKINANQMEMVYTSERKMGHFALGLIESTLNHFNDNGNVEMENLKEDGSVVKFIISRK